jgi:hypothetical protein
MWFARVDEGYLFGDLTPASVDTLKGVPMLIESADTRVRDRLLPETCTDPEAEAHWRQHAVPELERLFLSRAQLVRRDLAQLVTMPKSVNSLLLVRDEHKNAWIAALNAARLALFALNDLTAEFMEDGPGEQSGFAKASAKQQEAVLRIHLLAEIQSVLLGDVDVDPPLGSIDDFIID